MVGPTRQDIIGIQKNGLADGIPVVDCDSPKKIVGFFWPPEISNQDLLLTYIPYSNDAVNSLLEQLPMRVKSH